MRYHLPGPELCRSVDLGFGYVKFSKAHTQEDWELSADAFPSLAPPAPANPDVAVGVSTKLNVALVSADGETFAVGPDAMLAAPGFFSRILEDSFFRSKQYLALYRGALYFMGLTRGASIDYMTVGLPFTVYREQALRDEIATRLSGWHDLPGRPGSQAGEKNRVHVKNVRVIPQVMGSLLAQTIPDNTYEMIQDQNNLTVDVGYGTMMWMVSRGLKADAARCGAVMGGVSSAVQAVAKAINPQLESDPRILERIDKGLRDSAYQVRISGKEVDLRQYKGVSQHVTAMWTSDMMRSLGSVRDIDNVFLSGGGAHLYKANLEAAFPDLKISLDHTGGRFTNLRGFQLAAERRAVESREVRGIAA